MKLSPAQQKMLWLLLIAGPKPHLYPFHRGTLRALKTFGLVRVDTQVAIIDPEHVTMLLGQYPDRDIYGNCLCEYCEGTP